MSPLSLSAQPAIAFVAAMRVRLRYVEHVPGPCRCNKLCLGLIAAEPNAMASLVCGCGSQHAVLCKHTCVLNMAVPCHRPLACIENMPAGLLEAVT